MIDYLKENWKTVFVAVVVGSLILWGICGCDSSVDEPAIIEEPAPAVEEVSPEKVID